MPYPQKSDRVNGNSQLIVCLYLEAGRQCYKKTLLNFPSRYYVTAARDVSEQQAVPSSGW